MSVSVPTRTVLVIDDNSVDREAVRRHLGASALVVEATTATEGLRAASGTRFDCVLLDHRLPDGEGIDLVERLTELGNTVIMLTGRGDQLLAVEAMKRGASDYLMKARLDRIGLMRAIEGAIERSTLRRELSVSEARKAAVMEAALDSIVLMDGAGTIVDFNAAAEQTFRCARADVIGTSLAEVMVPPRLRAAHVAGLQHYLDTGDERMLGRRLVLPAVRKDGTEFPAEIVVVRIRHLGPPMFTGYIRDITDRLRAAEADALRLSMEAIEEVNAELEAFSYAVAHDLRAPLRVFHTFGAALLEEQELGEAGRRHVERITKAATNMGQLIDALLTMAHSTRGPIELTTVDVSSHVHSIIDALREAEPSRHVETVIAGDLTVRGDARLIAALFQNLLANAWKFTRNEAQPRIEVGLTEHQGLTAIFVRDNGVGFDMAHATTLFTPFQRFHASSEFAGTGIGLATAARIVRRHGGQISAEAAPGRGATFFITLLGSP